MVNLVTSNFFWVSLLVLPQSNSTSFLGFTSSILIQSTGQALSHIRQEIQSSISTCKRDLITLYSDWSKPIFFSGIGNFSWGYWSVATCSFLFLKCSNVKDKPVRNDFTPFAILLKYAVICSLIKILTPKLLQKIN